MINNLRGKIEKAFESYGYWVCRNQWMVLIGILVIAAGMLAKVPQITIDTSTEGFFNKDDPALVVYQGFKEQYGRDEIVIAAINPAHVFDQVFLLKLKEFHEAIESQVPYLDDVTSLINVTSTRGEEGELIVEDLLENWPEDEEGMAEIKERVLSNPLYRNSMISEDGRFTTVIIKSEAFTSSKTAVDGFSDISDGLADENQNNQNLAKKRQPLSEKENRAFVAGIREVTAKFNSAEFPIQIAGGPTFNLKLMDKMQEEMPRFTLSAILIIIVLLLILFRRVSGIVLPLIVVILALGSTFGLMALFGVSITVISQILPSFMLAVGVGDSVHLLTIFYRHYQKTGNKEDAIAYSLGHSGLAMAMTSLTTAGGLLSFTTAKLAPIAALGAFGAAGVMLALVYTIVLLPALLAILPIKFQSQEAEEHESASLNQMDKILLGMGDFASNRPWTVVGGSLVLAALASIGISQLLFSHNPLAWLPEDDELRQATLSIDHHLKGSNAIEIVVDTKKENGLYEPEIMNKLEEMNRYAEQLKDGKLTIGKSFSVADTLKQIHKSLNENQDEFYAIPQSKELIAQELLLFENGGTDDLETLVDSQFSQARVSLRLPWVDANHYFRMQESLKSAYETTFQGLANITLTGMISLFTRTVYYVMQDMITSYMIAGVVITVLMVVFIGNLKVGLLSMLPNFFPIFLGLGVMGAFKMPLDLASIMLGSIAIGLAVDDTIHFMHNFQRYYQQGENVREAVHHTLQTAGRAMVFTTIVLSSGFFVFAFASMKNLFNFGIITGVTIIFALFADILLSPALMVLINRNKAAPLANH